MVPWNETDEIVLCDEVTKDERNAIEIGADVSGDDHHCEGVAFYVFRASTTMLTHPDLIALGVSVYITEVRCKIQTE